MGHTKAAQCEPDIDVVMVVHDRKRLAFEGIALLLESPVVDRIVVVDNASADGLKEEGPEFFPGVDWLCLDENLGCVAWNLGMQRTVSPFALILDDDCVPDPASLEAARRRMSEDSSIGLAAFNVVNYTTDVSEWGAFEHVDGSDGWANAIGACMLVRVEAFREVGGYKDFFLCYNDLELVLSLWKSGWRVVYEQSWKARHKREPGRRPRRFHWEVRNFLATSFIHFGVASAVVIASNFLLRALLDARGDRATVFRAARKGVRLGLRLRGRHPGKLPTHVKRLFYANFLFGIRSAEQHLPRRHDGP